jgi:hypothetical protein
MTPEQLARNIVAATLKAIVRDMREHKAWGNTLHIRKKLDMAASAVEQGHYLQELVRNAAADIAQVKS